MTRYLLACLTLALSFLPAAPAVAAPIARAGAVYDSVDALEPQGAYIVVTGIAAGDSVPSELSYRIDLNSQGQGSARCDRLALLAIAKPGKYQFVMVAQDLNFFTCKLIARAP